MTDLCFMTARELRAALGRRELSAREVLQAHLDQIERINPDLGGAVPVEPEVAAAVRDTAQVFAALGAHVTEGSPDFAGADEAFRTQATRAGRCRPPLR